MVVCLAGCAAGEWPAVERGDEELLARAIVWASFGGTDEAPPSVSWEAGEECSYLAGRYILRDGRCLLGWYRDHHARVIWTDKISASAYAHELYHGWLWVSTGDSDTDHWDPGWLYGGVVTRAGALLRQSGL